MAKSRYERYNFVLAVLGAITGVLSLGWQMWGALKPIEDKIVAEYEITVNAQQESEILVSVTNIGEKDVYFSTLKVVYSDSKFDLGPDVPLTFNADEPLKPGQNKKISVLSVPRGQFLEELSRLTNANLEITTTRGEQIIYNDLYSRLFPFVDAVKPFPVDANICPCSYDALDCSDLGEPVVQLQDCFMYCYSLGMNDIHNIDKNNDYISCNEAPGKN